ncbi:hypothetical protein BATDEDRAFT_86419 [Batrachochytrium dendrobatidis JAM81]|uniref:Uncharacterized protein n=1 Tax=Batrachochytrium dendrobatidis (strain JAM81 / FGSC 10211) TaxID=684364 RepID=F4NWF5_BATDJ|nr:uncharacterized protein BATDEDRAFT_86419 [Batrachochytrium dendrobatidis JAM81]EGF82821.1 hypothetical protein BATDEDRAFT_86419 [Batrachochytrium dendrobatidis JAM81]|eukprot:XP_006677067.1 hypothetical protein BATDEDRAFT_86419 [Batrachochytrium dendrobatidis JAM81]
MSPEESTRVKVADGLFIPLLTNTNFQDWNNGIHAAMSSFNLWELHIKIAPPEEKTNTFIVNDYKAYSILATTTGKENDDLTHNSEGAPLSAHDAYKAIHAHYSTGSTSSRIQLFADLNAMVYDPDQGVEVLYNSMMKFARNWQIKKDAILTSNS